MPKAISVIIPCYNEGNSIYNNIKKVHSFFQEKFETFEIIAVNDGSFDNTLLELERVKKDVSIEIVNHSVNRGKGKSVRDGVAASKYDLVMFLDADLAIPVEETIKFLDAIEGGFDMVIASRFVPGLKILEPVVWYRAIMEKIFRLIRMLILDNYRIKDTQCGFKMFTRKVVDTIFPMLTVDRFAFDAEFVFLATKNGFKIKELPIKLQNPKQSSVRIVRDSLNMIDDLMKIRWRSLTGGYKRK